MQEKKLAGVFACLSEYDIVKIVTFTCPIWYIPLSARWSGTKTASIFFSHVTLAKQSPWEKGLFILYSVVKSWLPLILGIECMKGKWNLQRNSGSFLMLQSFWSPLVYSEKFTSRNCIWFMIMLIFLRIRWKPWQKAKWPSWQQ